MKSETLILVAVGVGAIIFFQRQAQAQEQRLNQVDINKPLAIPTVDSLIADTWQPSQFNGVTLDHIEQTQQAMDQGSYDPFFTNYDGQRYGFDAYYADPDPFDLGLEVKP